MNNKTNTWQLRHFNLLMLYMEKENLFNISLKYIIIKKKIVHRI